MYRQIFTGNLADAAIFQPVDDQNSVVNFIVAVNFPTGKKNDDGTPQTTAVFFPCAKWLKTIEKPKWLDYLTKGQKVLVESSYFKMNTTEKDGKTYQNMKVFVDKIELIGEHKKDENQTTSIPMGEENDIPF